MLSFLLTISRLVASQCYIWLARNEVINFEMKVAASAILLGREMLILLHVIVIDQQRCSHKRDKGILQERCNDVMSILDNSKQGLAIFSKDKNQKLAIANANAIELLAEQNSSSLSSRMNQQEFRSSNARKDQESQNQSQVPAPEMSERPMVPEEENKAP